ncbi:hypothetical protein BCEP4_1250051 [Burkholderia cepacia]|nr:hypothetical protein BCEP4_1250051 [Burkholderia cepacia]
MPHTLTAVARCSCKPSDVGDEDQIEPVARARIFPAASDADGFTMDQAGEEPFGITWR